MTLKEKLKAGQEKRHRERKSARSRPEPNGTDTDFTGEGAFRPAILKWAIGRKFGELTAVRPVKLPDWELNFFLCRCGCGQEVTVSAYKLLRGFIKSCGCRKESDRRFVVRDTEQHPPCARNISPEGRKRIKDAQERGRVARINDAHASKPPR